MHKYIKFYYFIEKDKILWYGLFENRIEYHIQRGYGYPQSNYIKLICTLFNKYIPFMDFKQIILALTLLNIHSYVGATI